MIRRMLIQQEERPEGAAAPRAILDSSHVGEGDNVFAGALLEKTIQKRKPIDWAISVGAHVALIAAVVILPLMATQRMDLTQYTTTFLTAPPPPMAPPPPLGAMHVAPQKQYVSLAKLTMPVSIPKVTKASDSAPEVAPDLTAGEADGAAGGVPGGVLGGILGGTGSAVAPPRPTIVNSSNKTLQVGGQVKRPQLVYDPAPEYPWTAQKSNVQGDVQIDAVVDKDGNVIQAHALSGPPMLIPAALAAVEKWKYQPTYLNGSPYPVELTVDVTFHLS